MLTQLFGAAQARQVPRTGLPLWIIVGLPAREGQYARNPFKLTIDKAKPVFDVAIEDIYYRRELLPPGAFNVVFEDTKQSDAVGPQKIIEHYVNGTVDAVMGLPYVFALAPIARVSTFWHGGVPVFTTTAMTEELSNKEDFPLLTRLVGNYKTMGQLVNGLIAKYTWQHIFFLFHDHVLQQEKKSGKSECYFALNTIKTTLHNQTKWAVDTFSENMASPARKAYTTKLLKDASDKANVIILCASPETVREIMLAAHDLGMATSGDYVFINIDVSTGSHAEQPWLRTNDTDRKSPENLKAKEAYKALKTISLRRSDQQEYKEFEKRVVERANKKYHYKEKMHKEYEMNNFISAFYDAVLLYAIALNETLKEGLDPRNGHNITSKMWGRTFAGITGNVSIDKNGDRYSDYSLFDLDPDKDRFVEVAYYSGAANKLESVGPLHWIGGKPPKDQPICGYDKSKCPKGYPLHVYLLVAAGVFILVMFLVFGCFYRRYRLEQELAAMSWKIRWEELDGEESTKKEKKKRKRKHNNYDYEGEALLRSSSRGSLNSDKKNRKSASPTVSTAVVSRSSSSGATRKISAMIDRKFSIFTRKKSSPNAEKNGGPGANAFSTSLDRPGILGGHTNTIHSLKEDGETSPLNNHQEVRFNDRRVSSPVSSNSDYRKKNSNEESISNKKGSVSLRGRKLSFGGLSFKSGGSVETIQMQNNAQIYTKTAVYKGAMVAIKPLSIDTKKFPKLDINRAMLLEFKKMKDLQHDHITRFTGACVDCPHYCIVTEYCPKGSLEDILENEKIELDKMMKYSLLHDLVKGMYFLHNSELRTHGRLKSTNCVVDSRFVLKVTDFGLHKLHALEDDPPDLGEHALAKKKLWTSPELLRVGNSRPVGGTQKGDVYSFAIILHEMLWRRGVFDLGEDVEMTPSEILERVMKPPMTDEDVFRPYVAEPLEGEEPYEPTLMDLMMTCWQENPHDRPDFSTIRKVVRSLNRENETSNLVDNLLKRMEQYANNLEGLVEERTQEYLAEKKKVEELLHQLLPPSVADQLIGGRAVQAETYESVTIYFSDIVGFTSLSSMSTPMQVVTLLNDLYLAFDGVVDNFKVYKVETIGDAYMVVSGLPERRDDHASQIAQMSIALLHKVKNFVIRHRPNEQLKLRIGMHSGSVVAGVVGSKMPRYCLFGDTVNTASRMESNGFPLRIHVSSEAKNMLDPSEFRLDLRGEVEMKGKGLQTTYWLKGYKEIDIPDFGPDFR
ncbi:unnamed protein product, partial [Mesorhabditis spiculigera]